jgi:hypothetical protein
MGASDDAGFVIVGKFEGFGVGVASFEEGAHHGVANSVRVVLVLAVKANGLVEVSDEDFFA